MWLVDEALGMTQGYVLDFSDKTFNDFVRRTFGIDVTIAAFALAVPQWVENESLGH